MNTPKACGIERKCAVCTNPYEVENVHQSRVQWWCSDYCKAHAFDPRICGICEDEFTPKRPNQHFCKGNCSSAASALYRKGVTFEDLRFEIEDPDAIERKFQQAKQARQASGQRFEVQTWSQGGTQDISSKNTRDAIHESRRHSRTALL